MSDAKTCGECGYREYVIQSNGFYCQNEFSNYFLKLVAEGFSCPHWSPKKERLCRVCDAPAPKFSGLCPHCEATDISTDAPGEGFDYMPDEKYGGFNLYNGDRKIGICSNESGAQKIKAAFAKAPTLAKENEGLRKQIAKAYNTLYHSRVGERDANIKIALEILISALTKKEVDDG